MGLLAGCRHIEKYQRPRPPPINLFPEHLDDYIATNNSVQWITAFVESLGAQPTPVRDAFNYCLYLLMTGKMRLVEKVPGENGLSASLKRRSGTASV